MKKYISPAAEVAKVECTTTIATGSVKIKIDTTSQAGDEQLQNRQQGDWGNLWRK